MVIDNEKISKSVYVMRALAIFSVVVAHITFPSNTPSVVIRIFQRVGCLGVPFFLLVSGFYYSERTPKGFIASFFKK